MTKAQAESIVKQYQEDMECDTFEEALESMTDCLDLLTPEFVAAVMLLNKETA
jgi:hypothetical protein